MMEITPVILCGHNNEVRTFALFDEGSTWAIMEDDLATKLEPYWEKDQL